MNIPIANSFEEAGQQIQANQFAYLPLRNFLPELSRIMNLKWILGLRSPVNTFTRLINPCHAAYSMYGVGAVVGTVAITLHMMSKADSHQAALVMAQALWEQRNVRRFS